MIIHFILRALFVGYVGGIFLKQSQQKKQFNCFLLVFGLQVELPLIVN